MSRSLVSLIQSFDQSYEKALLYWYFYWGLREKFVYLGGQAKTWHLLIKQGGVRTWIC